MTADRFPASADPLANHIMLLFWWHSCSSLLNDKWQLVFCSLALPFQAPQLCLPFHLVCESKLCLCEMKAAPSGEGCTGVWSSLQPCQPSTSLESTANSGQPPGPLPVWFLLIDLAENRLCWIIICGSTPFTAGVLSIRVQGMSEGTENPCLSSSGCSCKSALLMSPGGSEVLLKCTVRHADHQGNLTRRFLHQTHKVKKDFSLYG